MQMRMPCPAWETSHSSPNGLVQGCNRPEQSLCCLCKLMFTMVYILVLFTVLVCLLGLW